MLLHSANIPDTSSLLSTGHRDPHDYTKAAAQIVMGFDKSFSKCTDIKNE